MAFRRLDNHLHGHGRFPRIQIQRLVGRQAPLFPQPDGRVFRMTEDEQQRVFGAFERLSNAAAKDGFGLGFLQPAVIQQPG